MKAVLQRVSHASVVVKGDTIGAIDQGLLVFIGVEAEDDTQAADKLIKKLLNIRVFSDAEGKMNLSVSDIAGGILLVSQFTLAADTQKGNRPGFSKAAKPEHAEMLYDYMVAKTREQHAQVATGRFAADMKISLLNDGPVTFLLNT
ncbi:D-aminoacyl-tRNA deacylase [Halioxenophilus aromaticivorans]|uniref:D-aminoacyl-tRNA deacylase n=1 Tax=Halioxenophilus aromaticivorans TaxID=1306992 RepID=A0AAV3U5M1_9ALTE